MSAGQTHIIANYLQSMANNSPADKWGSDTIKFALITSSTTPSITDSNPCWGSGGSQNYSTSEVSAGGNYSAGGVTLSGCTVTQSGAVVSLNATSPSSWAASGSNPTNARWGIIYDSSTANKEVLVYLDLGSTTSLVPGFQVNWNGVASGTQPIAQGTAT
jgi:hypothetical protein